MRLIDAKGMDGAQPIWLLGGLKKVISVLTTLLFRQGPDRVPT